MFSAFLGIITILNKPFCLLAKEVEFICQMPGKSAKYSSSVIYEIKTLSFASF